MLKLQGILLLMAPFALVALYHHLSYVTSRPHSIAGRPHGTVKPNIGSMSPRLLVEKLTHGTIEPRPADAYNAVEKAVSDVRGELHYDGGASDHPTKGRESLSKEDADDEDVGEAAAEEKEEVAVAAADDDKPTVAAKTEAAAAATNPAAAEAAEDPLPEEASRMLPALKAVLPTEGAGTSAPAAGGEDVAKSYPAPTLSQKRLLDGSKNFLPVPDAESENPSDLRWRSAVPAACRPPADAARAPINSPAPVQPAGCVCPPGRRPYHTILTAQASTYQRWQTLIFYHHFKKQQRLNPCTEMVGFTRLLASSNGGPDDLMDFMPTVTVAQLGFDKTRGFQVINRPWTMLQFLKMPEWTQRIVEEYVYIAETDHLLIHDIPNRATPKLNVAFFFPYMSPVPTEQANVVKRYFREGNHLDVQPVGPSPAIVHVDNLKKLTPLWYDLSVELKHDNQADRAFGWVLEMWGYSIACARNGINHYVWQQLQIEPSSTWHQNVSAEDPFIYHYTFGVEYTLDGIPVVGAVGEWSLDKRHYFGAPPPRNLDQPPACAQECAWTWWGMFNEATAALGDKYPSNTGSNLRGFGRGRGGGGGGSGGDGDGGALGKALTRIGPWSIDGKKSSLHFHTNGRASSAMGQGKWHVTGELSVSLELCGSSTLTFDSATSPSAFTIGGGGGTRFMRGGLGSKGAVDDLFASSRSPKWQAGDESHTGVARLMGAGPWAWAGISTMAFYDHGVLITPWGHGTYHPDRNAADDVFLEFAGAVHRVTVFKCHKFTSVRDSDQNKVEGWIQLGGRQGSCGGGWF